MSEHREEPATARTVVVYGDFNCPFSALANARASRLAADGTMRIDWRCVEHDPTIGPDESPLTESQRADFVAELDQIRDLLTTDELDRFGVPSRRLNTRDLNVTHAATSPLDRQPLRTALFEAYWCDDLDLTDDAVVDGIVASVAGADAAHAAAGRRPAVERTVAGWQREWEDLPRRIVPMMVLPSGEVSRGLGVLARLATGDISKPAPKLTG